MRDYTPLPFPGWGGGIRTLPKSTTFSDFHENEKNQILHFVWGFNNKLFTLGDILHFSHILLILTILVYCANMLDMETKYGKFKRLANLRGSRTLEQIRLLGNLANRGNYDYADEDVRKLFSVLEDELRTTKAKFTRRKKRVLDL